MRKAIYLMFVVLTLPICIFAQYPNPTLYLPFDYGQKDASANAFTVDSFGVNGVEQAAGFYGRGRKFNMADYLIATSSGAIDPATTDLTFCMWVNFSVVKWTSLLSADPGREILGFNSSDLPLTPQVLESFLGGGSTSSAEKIENGNEWYFIAQTLDHTNHQIQFYIGREDTAVVGGASLQAPTSWKNGGPLFIGRHKSGNFNERDLQGNMDELSVFTGILTQAQINAVKNGLLYNTDPVRSYGNASGYFLGLIQKGSANETTKFEIPLSNATMPSYQQLSVKFNPGTPNSGSVFSISTSENGVYSDSIAFAATGSTLSQSIWVKSTAFVTSGSEFHQASLTISGRTLNDESIGISVRDGFGAITGVDANVVKMAKLTSTISNGLYPVRCNEPCAYKVYNLSGVMIQQGWVNNNQVIDITAMSSGMYFVELDGITTKVMKK